MIYLLIGYMWLYLHRPFEIWPLLAEIRIERIYMFITIAWWVTQPKRWIHCRSHFPVFLLATIYLAESLVGRYATFATVEDWFKVFVFYLLLVTSIYRESELKTIIVAFVCVTGLYELHSLREYVNGRGVFRMGTWRMIGVDESLSDPNSFGASVDYALVFLMPMWVLAKKRWQRAIVLASWSLGVLCVLLTGSRSAFVGIAVLLCAAAATSVHRWKIGVGVLVLPPIIWASLRADLQNRYLTLVDPSRGPENARDSAEGRALSFRQGMQSFAENPIFGAGLNSFRVQHGVGTHNLFNQALGELGLFGLAVLVGFAWSVWSDLREAKCLLRGFREARWDFCYLVCLAATLAYLLLFLLGWGAHNLSRYNWLWFGAFSGIAVDSLRRRNAQLGRDGIAQCDVIDLECSAASR